MICIDKVSHRILLQNGKKPTKTTLVPRWSRLCSLQTPTPEQVISSTPHTQTHVHANATRITVMIINNYMDKIYLVMLITSDYPKTLVTNLEYIYEFRQQYFFIEHLISVSKPSKITKLNSRFVF